MFSNAKIFPALIFPSLISMQITDPELPIGLGELCSPFRYSYPDGCINSVVLNTKGEKRETNGSHSNGNSTFEKYQDAHNATLNSTEDDINIDIRNLTRPLCIYSIEVRWPQNDDGLRIKLKVRQSSSADWFGIGFSTGYLMSDGVDAVIARASVTGQHSVIGQHWYWYDYPDPGSEIDYISDHRVDYIRYYDGVSVVQFKKKIKNHMPFELNLEQVARRGVWLLYPVFGGTFYGGTKKHYYTPIAKYYTFFQCGDGKAAQQSSNGQVVMIENESSPFPSQASQRRLSNGETRKISISNRIDQLFNQNSVPIQVQGEWGPWTAWSPCSLSCGQGGNQKRSRKCDNPVPRGTGMACVGESDHSRLCAKMQLCPDHVSQCKLPAGAKSNWTWPTGCSASTHRSSDIQKCNYAVFWNWMNGLDVSQFTIVSPHRPKMWTGIQFSGPGKNDYGSNILRSYLNSSTGDVYSQCEHGQLSETAIVTREIGCELNVGIKLQSVQLVEYHSGTIVSDAQAELDAIANGGDALLSYRTTELKDQNFYKRDTDHFLLLQFSIDVFDPHGLRGLDLSNTSSSTWFFPVDGGKVEYGVSSVKFLPPPADKLQDDKITLVPCQPPNRKRSKIKCYVCQGSLCYMNNPGKKEICPPGATTCQKFIGKINGMHHRMHMCGLSNQTATLPPDGECKEGIFQSEDGKQLEGTICECWKNACNHSTKNHSINSNTMLLMSFACVFVIITYMLQ